MLWLADADHIIETEQTKLRHDVNTAALRRREEEVNMNVAGKDLGRYDIRPSKNTTTFTRTTTQNTKPPTSNKQNHNP
eukprot:scaffold27829_cov64-Cyclotella_meneghiniana.AAC.9